MKLEDLLPFDSAVIQCHNDPDADAIASGLGVLTYLRQHGKTARLIYGGNNEIEKSNLVLMTKLLDIPIEHVTALEGEPDLLLTVDCQYGERNVQKFPPSYAGGPGQLRRLRHHHLGHAPGDGHGD